MDMSITPQFASALAQGGTGAILPVSFDSLVARLAVAGELAAIRVKLAARQCDTADTRHSLDARIDLFGGNPVTERRRAVALGAFFPSEMFDEKDVNPSGSTNIKSEADILPKSDINGVSMASEDCSEAARGTE